MKLLLAFETTYTKKTKSRKKCRHCGKLIQDGERVKVEKVLVEKYYPVKGIMGFVWWHFWHAKCKNEQEE